MNNGVLRGHTIYCQSYNIFGYFTWEISVFVLLSVLFSLVWNGQGSVEKMIIKSDQTTPSQSC